jgi:hypothetical protein
VRSENSSRDKLIPLRVQKNGSRAKMTPASLPVKKAGMNRIANAKPQ